MIAKIKRIFTRVFPYGKLLHLVFIGVYPSMILSKFLQWYWVLPIVFIIALGIEICDKYSEKDDWHRLKSLSLILIND